MSKGKISTDVNSQIFLRHKKIKLMKKNIAMLDLAPGDRIVIPKSEFRIVQHHGIYLGKSNRGVDLVAENKMGFGVRIIPAAKFFENVKQITKVVKFKGTSYERRKLVERIVSKVGHSYHLINYNCQHFANDVLNNEIKSEQVDSLFEHLKIAAVLLLTIGFVKAIADN
jgi:hypothetical protein